MQMLCSSRPGCPSCETWLLATRTSYLSAEHAVRGDEVEWPAAVVDPLKQLSWDDKQGLDGGNASVTEANDRGPSQVGKGKGKGKGSGKYGGGERKRWGETPCQVEA